MTVEEGHVLNIDGSTNSNKYKTQGDRSMSAVSRGSAFHVTSDVEDGGGGGPHADRVSVLSGASGRSKTTSQLEAAAKLPWYRGVTCKDIKDITPTVLILIGGLLIMIFVIPYAFSSVIKQLEAEQILEAAREKAKKAAFEAHKKAAEEAAARAAAEAAAAAAAENTTAADAIETTLLNTWTCLTIWQKAQDLSRATKHSRLYYKLLLWVFSMRQIRTTVLHNFFLEVIKVIIYFWCPIYKERVFFDDDDVAKIILLVMNNSAKQNSSSHLNPTLTTSKAQF